MLLVRVPLFFLYLHIVTVIAAPAGGKEKLVDTVVNGAKGAASKYKGGLRPGYGSSRLTSPFRSKAFFIDKSSVKFIPAKYYSTLPPAAKEAPTNSQLQQTVEAAFKQQNSENTGRAKDRWRIDPECVAAAMYVARQAVIIGGSAMLAEMMPGSVVGGTQSFIGAVFGITGAADETIGEKLRNMPESAAQKILRQNGIPYKKNMTKEELVQFIDDMIEKAEAVRDDLEVWEGEDGEDEGDVSGSHSESKSDSTLNSTEKETTEAKGERLRRNGVSRVKRTSLQPRKMTLDGLCEKMVPRVKTFREAQQNVLKFKGVRGALTSRIKILATTCPIGWIVGAITKGVGEFVGGGKAGDMAAQKEEEQKKAAAKAKADALKEEEESSQSSSDTEVEADRGRKKTSDLDNRSVITALACVPVIGGLFAGAAVENGLADDFFADMAIEKYEALVEILQSTNLLKEFTLYERDLLAILVPL